MSLSTPAQRRAVAPPARREREVMRSGGMPVESRTAVAAARKAVVMWSAVIE